MLTGQRAFQGDSAVSTMSAVLRDDPAAPGRLPAAVPSEVARIVRRCLEKDRALRYPSGAELYQDLSACQAQLAARQAALWAVVRTPRVAVPALALLAAILAAASWFVVRSSRIRWAQNEALPEIARLADQGKYLAAYPIAQKVEQLFPNDPLLARLWPLISQQYSVRTTPPGAEVDMKEYGAPNAEWTHLGRTPLDGVRIPKGYFRWRITREGFQTVEAAGPGGVGNAPFSSAMNLILDPQGAGPAGMVHVPAGTFVANLAGFGFLGPLPIAEFSIDRFEVTNKQYKEFVDHGGYQKREYWKHAFVNNGRTLSWEQAMPLFRDATGRPGPATWEAGTYPDGKEDFPVSGVSWYEAAAYAEFAGKSLPTLYHWYHAASVDAAPYSIPLSNIGTGGPAKVGNHAGLGPYGTYDMAGNVKEWCWNEEASGGRYILGGAWNEPPYMFNWPEPRPAFDRAAGNGFRCVRYSGSPAPPAAFAGPMQRRFRDFSKEKPVSDAEFRIFRRMYSYDPGPLDAAVVSTDDSSEHWKKLKVAYNAAYNNERIPADLYLPKNVVPPYEVVIFYPGANALQVPSIDKMPVFSAGLDSIVKSGRALLWPVYKGTLERRVGLAVGEQNQEISGQWSKDLGRSIDYLQSRPDIDRNKIAYCGHSMGARVGIMLLALEPRVKAAIFLDGGLSFARRPPEIDEFNYAPRVKIPLLMLNGRYDFIFPVETSQNHLFRLIGTPEKDKRHVVYETSHNVFAVRGEMMHDVFDWLDRYLGPVKGS
jgi:formylglycine-generating enzyme required for sulfatase activity/dienelactone hydrolase